MAQDSGLPPTPKLKIITSPSGARFSVAAENADVFQGLINDLEGGGYAINRGKSGGYNQRFIAGTTTPSEHAFGRAIDVNWDANPRGGTSFAIPPNLARNLAAKYGLTWGGDWSGPERDPMHFEVARPQGRMMTAQAQPSVADTVTPPTPTPAPTPAPAPTQTAAAAPPFALPPSWLAGLNQLLPNTPSSLADAFIKAARGPGQTT